MRYDVPLVRTISDNYLTVELGDVIDLRDNMRLQGAARLLDTMCLPGVIEVVPHLRSLALVFESGTNVTLLAGAVREAIAGAERLERVRSRLFRLPVWYDDPFSDATAKHFGVENNLSYVARLNRVSVPEAVARHTGGDAWVVAVGFVPGCFWSVPLDPSLTLSSPKYLQPRDRTPSRTVALAGITTTIYPYPGPGGYQCIGRCAVDVYRAPSQPADPMFGEEGVLVRPGDRHRYYSVGPLEYEAIRQEVHAGTYRYDVIEEDLDVAELFDDTTNSEEDS